MSRCPYITDKNSPENWNMVKVSVLLTLFLDEGDKELRTSVEVFSGDESNMKELRVAAKEQCVPRATDFELEILY